MFTCMRCGACCRNLRCQVGIWQIGLFLFPRETELFKDQDVAPMWGVGVRGNSRPRPAEVYFLQLRPIHCPHITAANLCRIYEKRPLVCKAHPLELHMNPYTFQPEGGSLDTRCAKAKEVQHGAVVDLKENFSLDVIRANIEVSLSLGTMFKEADGRAVWLYDLKTERWIMISNENVDSLRESYNLLYKP